MGKTTLGLNLKGLNNTQLMELVELDMQMDLQDYTDNLKQLVKKITFVYGKKGKGKTAFAVAASWGLREYFDQPVVCIGSKMGLGPAFGPFDYMPEVEFKEELAKIDMVANEDENAEMVAEIFKRKGIKIMGATIIFDEAYKLMNARSPQDKMVKLTVQFVSQCRHYLCTPIILAPDERMIDKLIVLQMDWKGQAFWNKYTYTTTIRLQYGVDVITFEVDLTDGSLHTPFGEMYNSQNILGYRPSTLNIQKL
jgi:hypothetical protein